LLQKPVAGIALVGENTPCAAAGIHQQTDGQGKVGFAGEVLDGLRAAILIQQEIVLFQVTDDLALLVADRGEHVHDLDTRGKRGGLLAPQVSRRRQQRKRRKHCAP